MGSSDSTICAVELTMLTGTKVALISCYLPQPLEEHARACSTLTDLTRTLPHEVIITGGGLARRLERK